MYLPIMSVFATFLNEGGFSLSKVCELLCRLVKVDDSHSLTTVSFTALRGSGVTDLLKNRESVMLHTTICILAISTHKVIQSSVYTYTYTHPNLYIGSLKEKLLY
jgi:hypothetical protein